MKHGISSRKSLGFVLIEALVAVLIVALGILALAKLQTQVLGTSAEAKERSAAMAVARATIDGLRNSVIKTQYTALASGGPTTTTKDGISFTTTWTVSTPSVSYDDRLVQVTVTWTDRFGQTRQIDLNSRVAWSDPINAYGTQTDLSGNLITPSGSAKRGDGSYKPGDTAPTVVTGTADNGYITRLLDSTGKTILYLEPVGQTPQQFTKIYGRVYFDQEANQNQVPDSDYVYVRLSSEGECVYDHVAGNLSSLPSSGSAKYKYFGYVCYVGPDWYGNIGISVIGSTKSPTVCAGDPQITETSKTTSPYAIETVTRSYRGFKLVNSTYISTGMQGGTIYGDDGTTATKSGSPVPSAYNVYGISAGSSQDFYHQDFLVTKISGNTTCSDRMTLISGSNTFSPNAGKYYCISPDNDAATDECPTTWPGFGTSGACGTITISGSLTYSTNSSAISSTTQITCNNSSGAACSCQATSGTSNYSCTTTGNSSSSMTVTAVGSVTIYDTDWTTQTCIPSSSCVAPTNTTTLQYQCAQSGCSSGYQRTQSRSVSYGSWSNTACVPAASCSKPSDTSTTQYQCAQSSCYSGENIVQSRTINWGSWVDQTTYTNSSTCNANKPADTSTRQYQCAGSGNKVLQYRDFSGYGSWIDYSTPTCSTTNPTYTMSDGTVEYQYSSTGCNGQNKVLQHRAVTLGSWGDTASTCVDTSAALPTTSGQVWQSITSGCSSGLKQFQSKNQAGSTSTTTCSRTLNPLGCSSQSSVNIDSTTGTCQ